MKRTITGFFRDDLDDWIASLDCGHRQHVRHRPPFQNRPWVTEKAGREGMLGSDLECILCDRMEPPDDAVPYRRTPEFDGTSLPTSLKTDHATKSGIWGRIHVLAGELAYHVGTPADSSFTILAGESAIVVPEVGHRVEPKGNVRFFIEFSRVPPTPRSSLHEENKESE